MAFSTSDKQKTVHSFFYRAIFLIGILSAAILPNALLAQILEPAKWSIEIQPKNAVKGDTITLKAVTTIDKDWYVYASDFDPNVGPLLTEIVLAESASGIELVGELISVDAKTKYDATWDGEVRYFKMMGTFEQKVLLTEDNYNLEGVVAYQVCSDISGQCVNSEADFQFKVGKAKSANSTAASSSDVDPLLADYQAENSNQGLFAFMILAFLSGLVALLTPCVFPMIPMTVTFFTNSGSEEARKAAKKNALIFGLSIIGIYTVVGTAVAAINGPEFANFLSTHWAPNLFFFAVFFLFALSFMGMFEITLPHQLVNKVNQEANKGGLYGVFFMAFTLVVVSFSCTGPIVGSILVESAGGAILKPIAGMFAFSMAFAIPFTLFAIFPQWLSGLPKSGGWLNTVKVVLGFLELALGLKFLSVADQTYHWGILDREIYIALWIAIFTVMGIYLLGKLRLPHDSEINQVGVPRTLFAIATFSFVVYLIPGMFGAPLKALAGYLPPMATHDFALVDIIRSNQGASSSSTTVANSEDSDVFRNAKYADFLHLPHGIQGFFDYDEAMAYAKKVNKPLFIDFTGHGCVNCREMEARVWSDSEVLNRLKNDFVVVALYVDDKTTLPESEWYTSSYDGKVKKTIGKQNADFQISRFKNNAQPYYLLLDNDGKLLVKPRAYDLSISGFVDFLEAGKAAFAKRK
jgi:thiol:disulfide interchange protein